MNNERKNVVANENSENAPVCQCGKHGSGCCCHGSGQCACHGVGNCHCHEEPPNEET